VGGNGGGANVYCQAIQRFRIATFIADHLTVSMDGQRD
jgi:hypothetical protein